MTDEQKLPSDDWPRADEDIQFELATARTIMAWNECELHLIFFLQALLGVDQFRARTIWAGLPTFDAKRKMLLRLSHTFTPPDAHDKLAALLKRCSKLAGNRNILAHGIGGYSASARKVQFFADTHHPELGTDFLGHRSYDLNNLERWPHDIRSLIRDLMDFLPSYASQVSASSRMHAQGRRP